MLDADVKVMTSVGVGVGVGGLGGCMSGLVASSNFSGIERNDGILYLTNVKSYRKPMKKKYPLMCRYKQQAFHPVQAREIINQYAAVWEKDN